MPATLSFSNPSIDLPVRQSLEAGWSNIQDPSLVYFLTTEEQNLLFQLHLLNNLQATNSYFQTNPISLSVRAGFIRSIIFIYGAIVEASLRALSFQRKLSFRTQTPSLGNILKKWGVIGSNATRQEILPIKSELKSLHSIRKSIHLFEQARQYEPPGGWDPFVNPVSTLKHAWENILNNENQIMAGAAYCLECIKGLPPSEKITGLGL